MKFIVLLFFYLFSFTTVFANPDTVKHHSPHYRNMQITGGYYRVVTGDTVTLSQPSVTINDSTSDITKLYIEFPSHPYNNEWRALMIYPHIDTLYFINATLDYPMIKANKLTFRRFHYESSDNKWHWYKTHPIYYTGQKQSN